MHKGCCEIYIEYGVEQYQVDTNASQYQLPYLHLLCLGRRLYKRHESKMSSEDKNHSVYNYIKDFYFQILRTPKPKKMNDETVLDRYEKRTLTLTAKHPVYVLVLMTQIFQIVWWPQNIKLNFHNTYVCSLLHTLTPWNRNQINIYISNGSFSSILMKC